MATHVQTVKKVNFDRFHDEQYAARRDFDKIYKNPNATQKDIEAMLEKYEFFIQENFEPYAAMHESRQHSNLWGKMVLWGDDALTTDHIGFYSKDRLVNEAPTAGHYHEEYPHQIGAWMYDEKYLNEDFNYEDVEAAASAEQQSGASQPSSVLKGELDDAHKK